MLSDFKPKLDLNQRNYDDTQILVREPIEDICNQVKNDSSSKIILGGNRFCGKTTVLHYLENQGLGTENKYIWMNFDSAGWGKLGITEEMNYQIYQSRYEIQMCHWLLDYIKKYYKMIYNKHFVDINEKVNKLEDQMHEYMEKCHFDSSIELNTILLSKELVRTIVDKMYKVLSRETLSICIDRFDWTNNRNPIAQQILSTYFDLFDKVVITVDDKEVVDTDNHTELSERGFSYIDVNYGKNPEVIKEIIKNRIRYYNKNQTDELNFDEGLITESIYENLAKEANGNIGIILCTLSESISAYGWSKDIENHFKKNCLRQLKKRKSLENRGYVSKFHL